MKIFKFNFFITRIIILSVIISCTKKQERVQNPAERKETFSFMREGNAWKYQFRIANRVYVGTYRIMERKNNHYKIEQNFDPIFQFPAITSHWYADQHSFSMNSLGPGYHTHYDLIQIDKQPGEYWEYRLPGPEIKEGEFLSGVLSYILLEKNSSIHLGKNVYHDVIKIRQSASSHLRFYLDYYISMRYGLVKVEGNGFEWVANKLFYSPITIQLVDRNF
ncbi:hypothetical protein ACFRAE_06680 [Sphingobacterium sp. HJSM2_6]|uniref:hypothetical protein n=1 Tax=Sphingobacterium sp. HJSM2_6 TaxID=3366264 RepID=UPI003BD36245